MLSRALAEPLVERRHQAGGDQQGSDQNYFINGIATGVTPKLRLKPGEDPSTYDYVYLGRRMVYQHGYHGWGTTRFCFVSDQHMQPVTGVRRDTGCEVVYRAQVDTFGWTHQVGGAPLHQPLRSAGQYEDTETKVAVFDPSTYESSSSASYLYVLKPALHYNWMRYYDPLIGSFISPDPAGQYYDVNPYRYLYNSNPNYVDITGEYSGVEEILGGLGTAIGQALATIAGVTATLATVR